MFANPARKLGEPEKDENEWPWLFAVLCASKHIDMYLFTEFDMDCRPADVKLIINPICSFQQKRWCCLGHPIMQDFNGLISTRHFLGHMFRRQVACG